MELKKRFSNDHVIVFNGIRCLNPESKNFCNEEDLLSFAKLCGADIQDLIHEKYQIKRLIERKDKGRTESPKSILQLLNYIEPFQEVFPEFYKLCKNWSCITCNYSIM